jgi:hypothetical protein
MQIIMYCGRLRMFCTGRKPLHAMSAWSCTRTITGTSVSRITVITVTLVVETLHKCPLRFTALCNVIVKLCLLVQSTGLHVLATWSRGANCSHAVSQTTQKTKKDAYYVIKGGLVSKPDLRLLLFNLSIAWIKRFNTTNVKLKIVCKLVQKFNSRVNTFLRTLSSLLTRTFSFSIWFITSTA